MATPAEPADGAQVPAGPAGGPPRTDPVAGPDVVSQAEPTAGPTAGPTAEPFVPSSVVAPAGPPVAGSLERPGAGNQRTQWAIPRGLIVAVGGASLIVIGLGIRITQDILAPTFLALMLAVAASPALTWFRRRGWPNWAAVTVTIVIVFGVLIGFAVTAAVAVGRLATIAPQYSDEIQRLLAELHRHLSELGVGADQADSLTKHVDSSTLVNFLVSLLESVAGLASDLVFLMAVLFFMIVDSSGYPQRLASAAVLRPHVADALGAFVTGTRRYLVVSTVFGLIVGVFDTIALAIIGIPLPILWGLVSFVTNYIPNVGFVLGVIPPALLGLLDGGVEEMLLVIAVYSAINFVIQSLIQPKFVGDSVGLSVTVTFLALAVWTFLLGPLGALLAIPMTLLAKALLIDMDPSTRWLTLFLGSGAAAARAGQDGGTGVAPSAGSTGPPDPALPAAGAPVSRTGR